MVKDVRKQRENLEIMIHSLVLKLQSREKTIKDRFGEDDVCLDTAILSYFLIIKCIVFKIKITT